MDLARRNRPLLAVLLVGALLRLPGVAWGVNWPDGFTSHHPDEYTHVANADAIITPLGPDTRVVYPKAMGAHAAAPYLFWYGLHGRFGGPRIHIPFTIGAGRLIALLFGLAAIVLVYLIGRDALGDRRAGLFAAGFLALGGLHVTQSHFFLSDVPAVTWTLAAVWLLWRDLTQTGRGHEHLRWAAFAAGSAFAFKLFVFVFPALAYVVLSRGPRVRRAVHASLFAIAGVVVSSLGFETTTSLYRAMTSDLSLPFEFDRVKSALLYIVEMPGILSLPLLVCAMAGTWDLVRRLAAASTERRRYALVVFGSVPIVGALFVLLKLDHFPRHWLFVIPWACLAAGWWLARRTGPTATSRWPRPLVAAIFVWMLAFVADSERHFIFEPRNAALEWIRANVPEGRSVNWVGKRAPEGYRSVRWMVEGDPEYLVVEMHEMNNSLSGVNWRNSMPADFRQVFDGRSAERVAAIQALFRGTSRYREVARFSEHYLMPEYRLGMALVGDKSRSYISEVVIFRLPPAGEAGS